MSRIRNLLSLGGTKIRGMGSKLRNLPSKLRNLPSNLRNYRKRKSDAKKEMASIKEYNSFIDRLRKDNTMAGSNISYEFLKKPIFSFLRARNEQLIAKQNSNPTSPEAKKEVDAFHKTLISFAEESAKNVKSSAESLGFLKDVEATLNAKQPNFDSLISEINRNSNIQQYKKNTQVEILRNLKSYRNTAITLKNTL